MIKSVNISKIINYIVSAWFIASLAATSISNDSPKNYLFKLIIILVFGIITFLRIRINRGKETRSKLNKLITSKIFSKYSIGVSIITLYFATTLLYSENVYYGSWKLLNLSTIIVPLVLLTLLNLQIDTERLYQSFKHVAAIYLTAAALVIIAFHPFDYIAGGYKLSVERWSHVIMGRVNGFLFLILFLDALFSYRKVKLSEYIVLVIAGYSLYLIGLRAAVVMLLLLLPSALILVYYFSKQLFKSVKMGLTLAVILGLVLVLPAIDNTNADRMEEFGKVIETGETTDGAINARLSLWEISWEMIKKKPVLGWGLGGFQSEFENHRVQVVLKYPHNLFIELIVELGLMGWIFSLALITFLLLISYKNLTDWRIGELSNSNRIGDMIAFQISLLFLVLFSLGLGMFSKDISSQSLLWVSLSVLSWQWAVGSGQR